MDYIQDFNNGGVSCNHKCIDFFPLPNPFPDLVRPWEDEDDFEEEI